MIKVSLISGFFLAFSIQIQAQDSSNIKNLNEVVVTGQYKPQAIQKSVYQITLIDYEQIQKIAPSKLQDIFKNQLNFRFTYDDKTGGTGISAMGLQGQNVKILLDGVSISGRQGYNNEIDINQIDINTIERIEIIEGPVSVLYGADALAGVINIITKKISNAQQLNVFAKIQEETVGKEYGIKQGEHLQSFGINFRKNKWNFGGGIGYSYFGGWKGDSTGRELTWHKKNQISTNAVLGYTTNRYWVKYRFDGLDEIIFNPANFKQKDFFTNDSLALDQTYLSHRMMHQLQTWYNCNSNLTFQTQASYSYYSRQVYSTIYNQVNAKATYNPDSTAQAKDVFKTFTYKTIAVYKASNKLSIQAGIDINLENGKGERLAKEHSQINDYAFFATAEYTPSPKINIRLGFRMIKNSVYNAPLLVPSINTKFIISKKLDFRIAYANGFRSPSLRELYFNFFDVNHQVIGNPNLKAETSNSITASLLWKPIVKNNATLTSTLNVFYNDIKNKIEYAISPTNATEYTYLNIAKAKTRGVNLINQGNYKSWNASLGLGFIGYYNNLINIDHTLPNYKFSPEITASVGYTFTNIGLNANLFYKYTGKLLNYEIPIGQTNIVEKETDAYHWVDFTLNKKIKKYFTLNAGIKNLLNVASIYSTATNGSLHNTATSESIGYGRSYFAGIVFNLNKKLSK